MTIDAGEVVAFWSLLVILALLIAWVGLQFGKSIGAREQRDLRDDAAAAICPTCSAILEPGKRLSAAGVRVESVEIAEGFGDPYPPFKGPDPVDDANALLAIYKLHIERLERRGV